MKIKYFVFLICFVFSHSNLFAQAPFITTWQIADSNDIISLQTNNQYNYDYSVDWGDGSVSTNQLGTTSHTYTEPGVYTVKVSGEFPAINIGSINNNSEKILTIEQWGDIEWETMIFAFFDCSNLQGNFSDAPDLRKVTSLQSMFAGATNFNWPVDNWDVSNVTQMSGLFQQCTSFNQPLNNWDMSKVTNISLMFESASSFNQDLNNWNLSNLEFMNSAFERSENFNGDISGWDVSKVKNFSRSFGSCLHFNQNIGNWNTGSATNMKAMFVNATAFNQNISQWDVSNVLNMSAMFSATHSFNQDINQWNVSNVTDMKGMFANALSFNQDISNWDVSNVNDFTDFLRNTGFSTKNYDALLVSWNQLNLQPNLTFSADGFSFCNGALARQNIIDTKGWTFIDAGLQGDIPIPNRRALVDIVSDCPIEFVSPPKATIICDSQIHAFTSTVFPIVRSKEVEWVFLDDNGDTVIQTQQVTINDREAPVPDVLELPTLRASCALEELPIPTATDNCQGTVFPTTNPPLPITESFTITWTFLDASNNRFNQQQEIIIEDNESPVPDSAVLPDLNASCIVELLTAPSATDNCDGHIVATTDAVLPITESTTITWVYEDESLNISTQLQQVIVADTTAPEIECLVDAVDVVVNENTAVYLMEDFTGNSFVNVLDDCSVINEISQNIPIGDSLIAGVYDIQIEAIDSSNNLATCNFVLEVKGNPLEINNLTASQVNLYPNPVSDVMQIEMDNLEIQKVIVQNVVGQILIEINSNSIDLTELTSGIYQVLISTNRGIVAKTIIKQ